MASKLFKLDSVDLVHGIVVAIFTAVITYFYGVLNQPGFDFATINWSEVIRISVSALIGYMGKNFFSDEDGKIGGVIG